MGDETIVYDGMTKQLIRPEDDEGPQVLIQRFKDTVRGAGGAQEAFEGKGELCCSVSCHLFESLEEADVDTHFLGCEGETDMVVRQLDVIPLMVVVRNVVAGALADRIGLPEGEALEPPVVETYFKNEELGYPLLAETHLRALNLVEEERLAEMQSRILEINDVLVPLFAEADLQLVDYALEFGVDADGRLRLGDEISPDTARIWESDGGSLGDEEYWEVVERLGV